MMNAMRLLQSSWPAWELVREIGAGSQGTVFVVRRTGGTHDDADYAALKICRLRAKGAGDTAQTRHLRLLETIRTITNDPSRSSVLEHGDVLRSEGIDALASHPNITRVLDWTQVTGDEGEYLLILMELLVPLEDYVGFDVRRIGIDIASALSLLHNVGIYHLDVKPQNILVSRDMRFKLGDFGSSRTLYDLSKGDFPPGTLHYCAPEVLSTRRIVATASDAVHADVYSLGMVLFELELWAEYGRDTHGPLDEAHDREEWFTLQREFELRLDSPAYHTPFAWGQRGALPELQDVIARAMAHDPYARYGSASEMRASLMRLPDEIPSRILGTHPVVDVRRALEDSFHNLTHGDVRETLILKYASGVHRPFEGQLNAGLLSGLRLTYLGHRPPVAITLNEADVPFESVDGFVDLSLPRIFRDATVPCLIDLCVTYPDGRTHSWSVDRSRPERDGNWYKRPDWTRIE